MTTQGSGDSGGLDGIGASGESSNVEGSKSVCQRMRLLVHVSTSDGEAVPGADVSLVQEGRTIPTNPQGDADFGVIDTAEPDLVATKPLHYAPDGEEDSRFSFAEKGKRMAPGDRREIHLILDPVEVNMFLDADRTGILTCEGLDRWEYGAGKKGAIVLCNDDDDGGRGLPDNTDEVINGGDDRTEIAPLDIRRGPVDPTTRHITATLSLERQDDYERIRIFNGRAQGAAAILGPKNRVPAPLDISRPIIGLGMEAVRYDLADEPDIVLVLTLTDRHGRSFTRRALVRVAPWMMQHHLERPVRVFAARWARGQRSSNQAFRTRLRTIVESLGILFDETFDSGGDRWAQDCMEFGCSNLPTVATQSILVAPRSMGLKQCVPGLLAPSMGFFGFESKTNRDLDKFGNLEVTPPVFDRAGNHYPWGRIYYGGRGAQDELDIRVRRLVHAQRVQAPFRVDTSWLDVGHADEMMSFVPAGGGWKICLPNVDLAFQLLDLARAIDTHAPLLRDRHITGSEGEGFLEPIGTTVGKFLQGSGQSRGGRDGPPSSQRPSTSQGTMSPPMSRPSSSRPPPSSSRQMPSSSRPGMMQQRPTGMHPGLMGERMGGFGGGAVVCTFASTAMFNRAAASGIERTIVDLEEAIRLTKDRILDIPMLFYAGRMGRAAAMTGNMVNMLVLGTTCVMSKPYGPEIDVQRLIQADSHDELSTRLQRLGIDIGEAGAVMAHMAVVDGHPGELQDRVDLFALYVWCAMKRDGLTPCFIDSWDVYHNSGGEVHCATNTLRERRVVKWWELGDDPTPPLPDLHAVIQMDRRLNNPPPPVLYEEPDK